jgi:hypothetical protein
MKDKELKLEEIEASHTLVERGRSCAGRPPFFLSFFFTFLPNLDEDLPAAQTSRRQAGRSLVLVVFAAVYNSGLFP